jgi:8-oxo-dGTP pyrophosphatase MutT (NUDIX family)
MRGVVGGDVRDAATLVVLREARPGMQVLLLQRHEASGFMPGAWVFPGGAVDEADRTLPPDRWRGIDPGALRERFGMPAESVLGMYVAAVRETFEEAGLLLATIAEEGGPAAGAADPGLDAVDASGPPDVEAAARREVAKGEAFARWLAERRLVLDLGALVYWSRWVAPSGASRRFDTCFFVTRTAADQAADHDGVETTAQRWVAPAEALDGGLHLAVPTQRTLADLAAFDKVDDVISYGLGQEHVRINAPRFERAPDASTASRLGPPAPAGGPDGTIVPTLSEDP